MNPVSYIDLNRFSNEIYSDSKAVRVNAREQLIRITQNFTRYTVLNEQQQFLFPAWYKLSYVMQKILKENQFPYAVNTKKAGIINGIIQLEGQPPVTYRDFQNSLLPAYIVTMAHTPLLNLLAPMEHLDRQINLLREEGFNSDTVASRAEANARLAIVVGINYCHSLDPEENRRNKRYIQEVIRRVPDSHVQVMAFNWRPEWVETNKAVQQKIVKRLFRVLFDMNRDQAKNILANLMMQKREIIPFQRIREEIKNSCCTETFFKALRHSFILGKDGDRRRNIYLVCWDDDALKLRTEDNKGLFSHYDELDVNYPEMQIASTGYFMSNPEQDFVELASRADLVARQAIAHTLPNGSYLPEPNLIIKIPSIEDLKGRISFLRKRPNEGKGLEFLGVVENLNLAKTNALGKVVMGKRGAIQTSQPARVNIPKHIPQRMRPASIDNKKNIASLRHFCQSMLNPKKGFAQAVARVMPVGAGSAINTGKIAMVYTAFDPVDYIKEIKNWKTIYYDAANIIVELYNAKFNKRDLEPNFDLRAQRLLQRLNQSQDKKEEVSNLLRTRFDKLWKARYLVDEGVLKEEDFYKIIIAAINVSNAVFYFLKSKIDETPFVFPAMLNG